MLLCYQFNDLKRPKANLGQTARCEVMRKKRIKVRLFDCFLIP